MGNNPCTLIDLKQEGEPKKEENGQEKKEKTGESSEEKKLEEKKNEPKKKSKPKHTHQHKTIFHENPENGIKYPPFMRTYVYPPKKIPENENNEPPVSLKLEYILGSTSKRTNGNFLYLNKDNHLIYPAAACGVVFDVEKGSQKIFQKHNDDLVCISVHPDGLLVASGECGKKDFVYIWNSQTMEIIETFHTYKHFKEGGVIGVDFSRDEEGKYLCVVGGPEFNSQIMVYEWKTKKLLYHQRCGTKRTMEIKFNSGKKNQIVWLANNELKFFSIEENLLKESRGILSSVGGDVQTFYCCTFNDKGETFVGTKDGSVYVFKDNKLVYKKKVHKHLLSKSKGMVCAILRTENGFITCSKDRSIKVFEFAEKDYFIEKKEINFGYPVRDIVYSNKKNVYYVIGKFNGKLSSLNIETEEKKLLSVCHSGLSIKKELHGLDVIKNNNEEIISAGDDGKVVLFNYKTKKLLNYFVKSARIRSVACCNNGKFIAIGTLRGKVYVYDLEKIRERKDHEAAEFLKKLKCGSEEISCVRFSSDNKYLVVGSHNNKIYVFDVEKNFDKIKSLRGHTSFVVALDISKDSKYIKSTSGDYELLFWDLTKMERMLFPSELGDVVWHTFSCALGWKVRGIWDLSRQNDGTDLNSIAVDFKKKFIITGDDLGDVSVFKYPTLSNNPPKKIYIGHSSHTACCAVSNDGEYAFTAGGGDNCVFIWKVV